MTNTRNVRPNLAPPFDANRQTPIPLPSSKPLLLPAAAKALPQLKPILTRLAALKNAVQLTPFALESWVAGLSIFDPKIVNEAALRIAVSSDPWPDFGKLFTKCEEVRRRVAGTAGTASQEPSIEQSLKKVAAALQLPLPSRTPPYFVGSKTKELEE